MSAQRLPCGCVMDTVGDAFVYQPCSLNCEYYLYVVQQSKKLGKPLGYITDPEAR
jgi:hypothetical protein